MQHIETELTRISILSLIFFITLEVTSCHSVGSLKSNNQIFIKIHAALTYIENGFTELTRIRISILSLIFFITLEVTSCHSVGSLKSNNQIFIKIHAALTIKY
jgi:hypothetical protein